MNVRRSIYVFQEERNFEDAKRHLYQQMYSDCGYPKIEFLGRYGGEYRIDILSECSDIAKAANIIREHKGKFCVPKQRHKFLTFFLWFQIVGSILMVPFSLLTYQNFINLGSYGMDLIIAGYDLSSFSVSDYVITMQICAVLNAIVGIIFISKILKWRKYGFWGIVVNGIVFGTINIIMMYFIENEYRNIGLTVYTSQQTVIALVSMAISPLFLWAILQIRKNGFSCWKHLD